MSAVNCDGTTFNLFVDTEFPADSSSLRDDRDPLDKQVYWEKEPETVQWLRPHDIPCLHNGGKQCLVFEDGIEPNDIQQGFLGDCYFLSVLSVLAEFPGRIEKVFEQPFGNEGKYTLNIHKNGQKESVTVDD